MRCPHFPASFLAGSVMFISWLGVEVIEISSGVIGEAITGWVVTRIISGGRASRSDLRVGDEIMAVRGLGIAPPVPQTRAAWDNNILMQVNQLNSVGFDVVRRRSGRFNQVLLIYVYPNSSPPAVSTGSSNGRQQHHPPRHHRTPR
jgi:hypothetical protein